jgi:predicted site-specific integrase-resolvase
MAAQPRNLKSVDVAAERYDVNPRTVRRWVGEGIITGYRIGGKLLKVDINEIERNVVKVVTAAQAGR